MNIENLGDTEIGKIEERSLSLLWAASKGDNMPIYVEAWNNNKIHYAIDAGHICLKATNEIVCVYTHVWERI